ncbi:heterokaryon incompatibility protein-domain-containing protein [Trametes gibbosa]|nr:heterokaryon incompatibility protein-domain-containing protein [Trametes gibbosa]
MRLLNTTTARLFSFPNPDTRPSYGILSHVWLKDEASFQDIQALSSHPDPLSVAPEKVRRFCLLARAKGFDWLWLDTCCIDKTSSSELSEALNSMYTWYHEATVCYVYLHDVPPLPEGPCADPNELTDYEDSFVNSVWFTRGWTLQELLAPHFLFFLSYDWSIIGTKHSWASAIRRATKIDLDVLTLSRPLHKVSIARRMSWAANRRTTRPEDRAYSLLGLFGVNMAPIYGEGPERAFYRLQEKILTHCSPDQSIFAWGAFNLYDSLSIQRFCSDPEDDLGHLAGQESSSPERLLASSPDCFVLAGHVVPVSQTRLMDVLGIQVPPRSVETHITGFGIRVTLPLIPIHHHPNTAFLAILACQDSRLPKSLLCLYLRKSSNVGSSRLHAIGAFTPKFPQDMRPSPSSPSRQLRLHRGGLLFDPLPPDIQQTITCPTVYLLHNSHCPDHRSTHSRGRCFERVARMYAAAGKQTAFAFHVPKPHETAREVALTRTMYPAPVRRNLVSIPDIVKGMISENGTSAPGSRIPLLLPSCSTTSDYSTVVWETLHRVVFDMPSQLIKRRFSFKVVFEAPHDPSLHESQNDPSSLVTLDEESVPSMTTIGTLPNRIPRSLTDPAPFSAEVRDMLEPQGPNSMARQWKIGIFNCLMISDGYTVSPPSRPLRTNSRRPSTPSQNMVLSFDLFPSNKIVEHVDETNHGVPHSETSSSALVPRSDTHDQTSYSEDGIETGKNISTYTWSNG